MKTLWRSSKGWSQRERRNKMISAFGFGGAIILVVCAVIAYKVVPFAPMLWVCDAIAASICAIIGIANWGKN